MTLPRTDPRLGRHVHHDIRSRLYEHDTASLQLQSVRHSLHGPVLNQGQLGSCTGNSGIDCLRLDPFYYTLTIYNTPSTFPYSLDEPGAIRLYSAATQLDDVDGTYPPDDTGSSGLAVAKALKAAGMISGYTHTFSLDAALKALTQYPLSVGIRWYEDMFTPDPDGRVHIGGQLAGGHQIAADELDVANERIWFLNSWGASWGVQGRFYLTWADFYVLLKQDGDVTVYVPLTAPAPVPADPDGMLAAAFRAGNWVTDRHIGENAAVAKAARVWLVAKGL